MSAIETNAVIIRTGRLEAKGGTVVGTVRMQVLTSVPAGAALAEPAEHTWSDKQDGGSGVSNKPALRAGAAPLDSPFYPLAILPHAQAGAPAYQIDSDLFVPGEPVALWYNTPSGEVRTIGRVTASSNGVLATTFSAEGLAPGFYSVVASGIWSNITAVSPFEVRSSTTESQATRYASR